jgi:hypothetical protein
MFVPIILGSDKTTVSVATGHSEYWPLYASIGNIHNNVRRAHGSGVVLVGFLAIPKSNRSYLAIIQICTSDTGTGIHLAIKADADSVEFRQFRRKLFHVSLSAILESLRPGENTPEVFQCPDGHYRRVIWGIGPYIADYPEQALLACIVQGWCTRFEFVFSLHLY